MSAVEWSVRAIVFLRIAEGGRSPRLHDPFYGEGGSHFIRE